MQWHTSLHWFFLVPFLLFFEGMVSVLLYACCCAGLLSTEVHVAII